MQRARARPGGWAFQYANDHYPDVDDTAVVGMLLHRVRSPERYADTDRAGGDWIEGMQSTNGGWGAFDIDNNADFLNSIPFADHGALLDPPTVGRHRPLHLIAGANRPSAGPSGVARAGSEFLRREQEADGSWFGRWGTNYIYGTWSALCALNAGGEELRRPDGRGARWTGSKPPEPRWRLGRGGGSYWKAAAPTPWPRTPSQTAWAVLGLMAAGEAGQPRSRARRPHLAGAERRGPVGRKTGHRRRLPARLLSRYHGYTAIFPIWAIARYAG